MPGPAGRRAGCERTAIRAPGDVDMVDWIEHIPFRETRNYVMRVMEAVPVYRARLAGRAGPAPRQRGDEG